MKTEQQENNTPPLLLSLASKLSGDIDCSFETISNHSQDKSSCAIIPLAVIYPKTVNDIKEIISFANNNRIPISPRGCGLGETGGSLTDGLQVDLTRYFDQIKNINILDGHITVGAGVLARDIKNRLTNYKMEIPIITDDNETASIGGMVSNKEVATNSLNHGSIREWVEGLTIILSNGEEHKIENGITPSETLFSIYEKLNVLLKEKADVIKNSKPETIFYTSGFDIWSHSFGVKKLIDIIIGSQGTLCVITEVKLKIQPIVSKKYSTHIACSIDSYDKLNLILDIFNHHHQETLYCFDETSFRLAKKYKPHLTENLITNENDVLTIIGTITANDLHTLKHKEKLLFGALPVDEKNKRILDDAEEENYKITAKETTSLLNLHKADNQTLILLLDDIIIPTKHISSFLKEAGDILNKEEIIYTITGNLGFGHISIKPIVNILTDNENKSVFNFSREIFNLVKKYNGNISGTKNDGLIRAPFLPIIYSLEVLNVFREIKKIFDPSFVFNPKKKFDVDLSYVKQHIKQ